MGSSRFLRSRGVCLSPALVGAIHSHLVSSVGLPIFNMLPHGGFVCVCVKRCVCEKMPARILRSCGMGLS